MEQPKALLGKPHQQDYELISKTGRPFHQGHGENGVEWMLHPKTEAVLWEFAGSWKGLLHLAAFPALIYGKQDLGMNYLFVLS